MKSISSNLIVLTLALLAMAFAACSVSGGGANDVGLDGGTDTDADAGPDGGSNAGEYDPDDCPDFDCTFFVNGSLGDFAGHDGSSWELAFATVEEGLDAASLVAAADAGETECAVWVAAGTYVPTEDPSGDPAPVDERTKTFLLRSGVALYGGFDGTEASCGERDIDANETILAGDLDVADVPANNAYHVVTGADDATIDGFTITGGYMFDTYDVIGEPVGAGMLNDQASPTVENCTFRDNTSGTHTAGSSSMRGGGGMGNIGSSPTVTNCVFTNNAGGGMHNSGSSPNVTNCRFEGNTAGHYADWGGGPTGGGMANHSSSPTVTNCTFTGNEGGGMHNNSSSPTVTNCTFSGNSAGWGGGGGMANFESSSPIVINCTFSGNSAGGLTGSVIGPTPVGGGGMYNENSSPAVTNCTFFGNVVESGNGGGGMYNEYSSPAVTGCTFSGNTSGTFGGGVSNFSSSSPTVTSCILWGNAASTGDEIFNQDDSSIPTVSHSDVQGGCEGTGNIDADPMFVNANPEVGLLDLRLQADSPCVDTGSNDAVPDGVTTDRDGNPRIVDGNGDDAATVDMGAYEYQP